MFPPNSSRLPTVANIPHRFGLRLVGGVILCALLIIAITTTSIHKNKYISTRDGREFHTTTLGDKIVLESKYQETPYSNFVNRLLLSANSDFLNDLDEKYVIIYSRGLFDHHSGTYSGRRVVYLQDSVLAALIEHNVSDEQSMQAIRAVANLSTEQKTGTQLGDISIFANELRITDSEGIVVWRSSIQ